jgi:uncharacterized protein (TIGR02231 family)
LSTWFLRYDQKQIPMGYGGMEQENKIQNALQGKAAGISISDSDKKMKIRGATSISDESGPLVVINGQISSQEALSKIPSQSIKSIENLKDESATGIYGNRASRGVLLVSTKQLDDYTTIAENQLNVSFDIDIPYDVLSNGKVHSVALKEIKLPASYKYYAVPKAEKESFLLAEIADYSKYNLLPGEANIIFEGMYVGKTRINPSQVSDTLNLSMGRDKKVSIKREKVVDKSGTKFLSSKKEQTFTFDITVKNNKKEPIELLLKDQYPMSTDKEIEIELLQSDGAKTNLETGILSWQLQLKPNEIKKFRISYKVRYPKDQSIGNL